MENKMEEEFMKEEMKRNKIIFLIIGGIALVIILGFVLYKFVFNKDVSNTDNNDIVSTLSDDVTKSDDIKENNQANKNGNTLYVYQKGYSDMAPIVFTYDCKSENCNLFTTDKGFVLFDEDKVMYREMTSYEYEQINNSDKSPNGEELEIDGFKKYDHFREVLKTDSNDNNITDTHYIFNIDNSYFFMVKSNNNKKTFYNYNLYFDKYMDDEKVVYSNVIEMFDEFILKKFNEHSVKFNYNYMNDEIAKSNIVISFMLYDDKIEKEYDIDINNEEVTGAVTFNKNDFINTYNTVIGEQPNFDKFINKTDNFSDSINVKDDKLSGSYVTGQSLYMLKLNKIICIDDEYDILIDYVYQTDENYEAIDNEYDNYVKTKTFDDSLVNSLINIKLIKNEDGTYKIIYLDIIKK